VRRKKRGFFQEHSLSLIATLTDTDEVLSIWS